MGLQRSGNHAIISWLIAQFSGGSSLFFNNVKHDCNDPFASADKITSGESDKPLLTSDLRDKFWDLIVYSYENDTRKMESDVSFLESAHDPKWENTKTRFLEVSEYSYDVIILRDPFNFFASRLVKKSDLTGEKNDKKVVADWKELASEAMKWIALDRPNKIVILYNFWFSDKFYRKRICALMGGRFTDRTLNFVPPTGGGSSFDASNFNHFSWNRIFRKWYKIFELKRYANVKHYYTRMRGAKKMDVMERWIRLRNNPEYQEIFKDPDLILLSENLFGVMPGTREFIKSLAKQAKDSNSHLKSAQEIKY